MQYVQAMTSLKENGFSWGLLREYFPFGDTGLREGNYERLLTSCLEGIDSEQEQNLLLDLLDVQAAIFLEQCWVQNEKLPMLKSDFSSDVEPVLQAECHFASAWLQINSNHRGPKRGLNQNARNAMLNMVEGETLANRLFKNV